MTKRRKILLSIAALCASGALVAAGIVLGKSFDWRPTSKPGNSASTWQGLPTPTFYIDIDNSTEDAAPPSNSPTREPTPLAPPAPPAPPATAPSCPSGSIRTVIAAAELVPALAADGTVIGYSALASGVLKNSTNHDVHIGSQAGAWGVGADGALLVPIAGPYTNGLSSGVLVSGATVGWSGVNRYVSIEAASKVVKWITNDSTHLVRNWTPIVPAECPQAVPIQDSERPN